MLDENRVSSPDPHQLLEARDTLARLEQAVGKLSLRRQRIFLLHRLEHLTYAEIAKEVGMSVKGVKKQMANALAELRSEMERSLWCGPRKAGARSEEHTTETKS